MYQSLRGTKWRSNLFFDVEQTFSLWLNICIHCQSERRRRLPKSTIIARSKTKKKSFTTFLKVVLGEKIASPRLKIGVRNDGLLLAIVIARNEVTKQSFLWCKELNKKYYFVTLNLFQGLFLIYNYKFRCRSKFGMTIFDIVQIIKKVDMYF